MYDQSCSVPTLLVAEPSDSYDIGLPQKQYVEVLVYFLADETGNDNENVKLYTYRLPPELSVKPGNVLSVPFGAQQLSGIAVRLINQLPPDLEESKVKDVEEVISAGSFTPYYWELLNRVAQYYYTPLIRVFRAALPPKLIVKSQRRIRLISSAIPNGAKEFLNPSARQVLELLQASKTGDYTWKYIDQKVRGANRGLKDLLKRGWVESYREFPSTAKAKFRQVIALTSAAFSSHVTLTPRQQEILKFLRMQPGGESWLNEFIKTYKVTKPTLEALEETGCITIYEQEVLRKLIEPAVEKDESKTLTPQQASALEVINELSGFAQVLLHGVTGSGKTEVYLQAIAPILEQGKSALVLVPEIGLTPQLTDRFRARFGNKVCVYHSALSDGERFDTWRQMLTGEPQVVIGTRSAVFAPLPNLGLIILDEEHDDSFKQDQPAPTYHARTVAKWRAELEDCPIILGSATPSLETWFNVRSGRDEAGRAEGAEGAEEAENRIFTLHPKPYTLNPSSFYLSLPERIQSRPLPPVEVVDMRKELKEGNRSIFSRSLQAALEQLQEEGKQGILFIHRRGHSTFVSCRSCGYVIECPNCDVSLAYHYNSYEHENAWQQLKCHYCNFGQAHPSKCPECSSPYLKFFGSGTQRVAEELNKQFPQLRLIRFDSDTTRTKGSHRTLLTRFANKEADLLVGTQMLTKGLDLPEVTLVGVVAADGLMYLPDYRASERAFQTLTQVAGRSGRGDDPGKVIIQTYTPQHPVVEAVQRHQYHSFTETELHQRAALNYPPYGRLILLRMSSLDATEVQNTAEEIAEVLTPEDETIYEVVGPAPANILRVANRYRWQILLKFAPDKLPELPDWEMVRSLCPPSVSLTIDVDPLNLM